MKVYIDLQKLAISKVVDGTSPEYTGDINSNVFEILFFNYDNTNWFPTMSQLAPNGRQAGDFEADSLGVGETHDYTEDGVNYQRFTFTMGSAWVLMKGRSNLFIWYNVLDGAVIKKCVGKLNVMLNESDDNYFISNPTFNPAVKSYIDGLASDIEDELNDKVDAQNATIASLSQASPSVFDTAANIQLLQENKGVAVATDTGYIWYWDSTLTTPAYVSSGLQYNSLANYTKHSGNQLQDGNNNPYSPNVANIKLQFTKGDFNTSGQVTTNIYRIVTTMDYIFPVDIKVDIDYVTYYIYLYQYENNAWVGKGWKGSIFTISANTKFRLIVSTRATLTQNLTFYQYTNMVNSLRIIPSSDFNYNSIIGFKKYKDYAIKDVAHRGLSMYAPENTASAFKAARLFGFDIVECDVHYTSDDVPVIIHDYTVNRTSDGTGNVKDLTLAQLKTLDFGKWFNDAYEGEKILTLEEFIVLIKGLGLKAYIELKNIGDWTVRTRHAQEIVALIKSYNMLDNITFISASGTYLEEAKNVAPNNRLGYVSSNLDLTNSDVVRFLGLKVATNEIFFNLENNANITTTIIDYAVANNIAVETWIVNDATPLFSLNKYISGVTTNGIMPSECFIDKALQ